MQGIPSAIATRYSQPQMVVHIRYRSGDLTFLPTVINVTFLPTVVVVTFLPTVISVTNIFHNQLTRATTG